MSGSGWNAALVQGSWQCRRSAINGQRASSTTCQGWGRGFESLRPLQIFNHLATLKLLPHHCCGARGSTREAGNLKCGRIEHSRWPTRTPARATMAATLLVSAWRAPSNASKSLRQQWTHERSLVPHNATALIADTVGFDELWFDAKQRAVTFIRGEAREAEQCQRAIARAFRGQKVAVMAPAMLVHQNHPAFGEPLEGVNFGWHDHIIDDTRDHQWLLGIRVSNTSDTPRDHCSQRRDVEPDLLTFSGTDRRQKRKLSTSDPFPSRRLTRGD